MINCLNFCEVKAEKINPNEDWNMSTKFWDTKKLFDVKHGKTKMTDWYYVCYDTDDSRGDIPMSAWRFVHKIMIPNMIKEFKARQQAQPQIADYMTFNVIFQVSGYIPYIKKN